jgi:hypothetical protein
VEERYKALKELGIVIDLKDTDEIGKFRTENEESLLSAAANRKRARSPSAGAGSGSGTSSGAGASTSAAATPAKSSGWGLVTSFFSSS